MSRLRPIIALRHYIKRVQPRGLLQLSSSSSSSGGDGGEKSSSLFFPSCTCFFPVKRGIEEARASFSGFAKLQRQNMASNVEKKQDGGGAWIGVQGPGSLDLRSDVMTVPTPAMLAAVANCSLRDDVFNEDPTTRDLEAHVAQLTGKEAGLFVTSGTMGNQVALRSLLTQPPFGVLADHRSHIILYEAGGVSSLTGATVKPVVPSNGVHLSVQDVAAHAILSSDVHACPTRVISLENTLNGTVMPLSAVASIAAFARAHNIRLHCDGARLWEAAVASSSTSSSSPSAVLAEYCSYFDTISLCFSKGLGAPVGSIIVGDAATLTHARWVRKSLGGGMRQPGMLAAAARVAVDETFTGGLLRASHETAKKVEAAWTRLGGGTLVHPVQTNMCWVNLEAHGVRVQAFTEACADEGLRVSGGRLVTHYQIAQNEAEVLSRLERVFKKVLGAQSASQSDLPTIKQE